MNEHKRWHERIPRAVKRIELLVAVVATIAMYGVYMLVPRIDPRAGVDVWGSFAAMWPDLIAALLAGTVAWALQAAFFNPLLDTEERKLAMQAAEQRSWPALGVLVLDWLKWLAPFWLIFSAAVGR